jgi:hypothetical protein
MVSTLIDPQNTNISTKSPILKLKTLAHRISVKVTTSVKEPIVLIGNYVHRRQTAL